MPKRLALIGDHVCDWIDYDEPRLKPDEIRIRTELASGKYGTWAAILDQATFGDQVLDPRTRLFVPAPTREQDRRASRSHPLSFGTSAVGVVTDVGAEVGGFKPSDRVAAVNVDISETITTSAGNLHLLGNLDPILALCAEPAYVAFHCIRESNVRYGDTVAVVGLGALGLIAVHMAHQSGAQRVIALDPFPGRRKLAETLGADLTFDPREQNAAEAVHEAVGGAGVDVAIELSGAYPGLDIAIRCTRLAGSVCAAGFYRGEAKSVFLGREFHHNRLTLIVPHGCGGGHPPRDYPRWDSGRTFEALYHQMREGKLNVAPIINPVVGKPEAVDLFRRMRDEPDQIVKFAVKF